MRHRPFIVNLAQRAGADGKWQVFISRRLTGSMGKSGSTGESADLWNDAGGIAIFDTRDEAQAAGDAALIAGGPWSPIRPWRTL